MFSRKIARHTTPLLYRRAIGRVPASPLAVAPLNRASVKVCDDYSRFDGLTGAEIFHELMIEQNVDTVFDIPEARSFRSTTQFTSRNISSSFFPGTSREAGTWLRGTRE